MYHHNNAIKKLLSPGDVVYSIRGGQEMTITMIVNDGFETEENYFLFSEHKKLYFLTRYGYEHRKELKYAIHNSHKEKGDR